MTASPTDAPDLTSVPPALVAALAVLAAVVMWGVVLGIYLYRSRVARVYSRGARGTALVLAVEPTPMLNRRNVLERPTEMVVLATFERPRGVRPQQKAPAGQYRPGEVVAVVQRPGDPDSVRLDRPDLEDAASSRWALLAALVLIPVILARGLWGLLGG